VNSNKKRRRRRNKRENYTDKMNVLFFYIQLSTVDHYGNESFLVRHEQWQSNSNQILVFFVLIIIKYIYIYIYKILDTHST